MPIPRDFANYGRVVIGEDDLDALRFLIRVFNLEPYVAIATADLQAKIMEGQKASVPIISEHRAGELYFYFALILFLDSLGLHGGLGGIWFGDAEHREQAEKKRNELADFIMQGISERVAEGKMKGSMLTINPTTETDEPLTPPLSPRRK
jgi:hypothetical protein